MTLMTCVADHTAFPRAVGMPRWFKPSAMARNEGAPAARSSAMTGATFAARSAAKRAFAAFPAFRAAVVLPIAAELRAALLGRGRGRLGAL
jgi:hypothetical protein